MSAEEGQRRRGDACECIIHEDWPEGAVSCSAIFEGEGTYRCSRPEGHEEPHAACSPAEHPALVWVEEGSA